MKFLAAILLICISVCQGRIGILEQDSKVFKHEELVLFDHLSINSDHSQNIVNRINRRLHNYYTGGPAVTLHCRRRLESMMHKNLTRVEKLERRRGFCPGSFAHQSGFGGNA